MFRSKELWFGRSEKKSATKGQGLVEHGSGRAARGNGADGDVTSGEVAAPYAVSPRKGERGSSPVQSVRE
jgi:hypothetical protein